MVDGRPVEIVTAREDHVQAIVAAHIAAFPGFFLTTLGPRFLARMYSALVRSDDALAFVAVGERGVSGFVAGPLRPAGFFRRLFLQQGVAFAVDSLPALWRHTGLVARRLLRAATYRGEAPDDVPGAALLSSIAVVPEYAGSGTAGALLDAFCGAAASRGATGVFLFTDCSGNERANSFYCKHGFSCLREVIRSDARAMNLYWRASAAAAPGKSAHD